MRDVKRLSTLVSVALSVMFAIFGTLFAFKAYRDVDAAFNLRNMQYLGYLPNDTVDVSLTGKEYTAEDLYILGLNEYFACIFLYMFSFIIAFFPALEYLTEMRSRKSEE
jgi:hypothetical protein